MCYVYDERALTNKLRVAYISPTLGIGYIGGMPLYSRYIVDYCFHCAYIYTACITRREEEGAGWGGKMLWSDYYTTKAL